MPRAPNVISNFVVSLFLDRFANPGRDIIEDFVPSNTLPFSFTTFSRTLQRVENTIRVVDLVDRRWTLRTISTTASGVIGIAFKLADLIRIFVDVCRQSARAFTIETCRWNNRIVPFHTFGMLGRLVLRPVIPLFYRWKIGKFSLASEPD